MQDETMPATEAIETGSDEQERNRYEFAYHILPTVAEGEVAGVCAELHARITKAGGEILLEEPAKRFDLAYEVVKHLEGKNRRFHSAYFGWVRFALDPAAVPALTTEIDADKRLLRYLLIRLTKVEEANPFYFHQALSTKKVKTVTDGETVRTEEAPVVEEVVVSSEDTATPAAIDEALQKPVA